jgi:flagellar biosynthetic protein FliP
VPKTPEKKAFPKGRAARLALLGAAALGLLFICGPSAQADTGIPTFSEGIFKRADHPEEVSTSLEILFALTILSLAPSILILTTAFTRIVIVLSFLRRALSTQELPPNQVVIGLSLFLTFIVMAPTWKKVNDVAIRPYMDGEISQKEAYNKALVPIREFMFRNVYVDDLEMFAVMNAHQSGEEKLPQTLDEVPTHVLIPAFVISELKRAFEMGFLLYLPFVIIDMVVASVLISMGMLVLPPILISLPFKILLFVLVDGWHLLVEQLVESFMV